MNVGSLEMFSQVLAGHEQYSFQNIHLTCQKIRSIEEVKKPRACVEFWEVISHKWTIVMAKIVDALV